MRKGHVEFGQMLLEHGAVIDAQNPGGLTALHFAALFGQTHAVQFLLEQGADVNVRNNMGTTPSEMASFGVHGYYPDIVELMSAYGAEPIKK